MLTASRLHEVVSYDAETGALTRRSTGKPLCWRHSGGYLQTIIDGRTYYAHRLAVLYETGRWPLDEVDHINGIRDDNRFANLRECTSAQNTQNKVSKVSQFGMRGVAVPFAGARFRGQIKAGGKMHHLGMFDTAEEAHAAYVAAKARLHTFQPVARDA